MNHKSSPKLRPTYIATIGIAFLLSGVHLRADEIIDYVRDIKPILANRCFACHGSLKQESGLRLDAAQLIREGGDSGEVIEAGNAEESRLIQLIVGEDGERMPPEGEGAEVPQKEIALLKAWIDQGAKAPAEEVFLDDPLEHWSHHTPVRLPVPTVKDSQWTGNPIDAFIAAKHEKLGLTPRPLADKSVLLRRIYLDLIGIPPTRGELQQFLADDSPEAYKKIVDRLLERPEYGQRWGRHWMDVWRYSDWYGSRGGNEIRYSQRHIWRWRDWIIDSLNEDKGYDRMIVEMLAGDEVAPTDPQVLRATGFLGRNWYKFDRDVWMQELVEHTSIGFLGVVMKCARCHDHKFDPISQKEYYQFRAYFEPHDFRTDPINGEADPLKDGVARIYDAKQDAPTYLYIRGDGRYPLKENPLSPSTPSALGGKVQKITPILLPLDAYYPVEHSLVVAQKAIAAADAEVTKTEQAVAAAKVQLEQFAKQETEKDASSASTDFLQDDFSKARPKDWKVVSGQWVYENGKLIEKQVGHFLTMVTLADHPRDFKARIRYTTTTAGNIRSVGVFFDAVDLRDAQAVYTSANDTKPSVQAFHRQGGKEAYPKAGIVRCEVKPGKEVLLEIEARGSQLTIWVDGDQKLVYTMPMKRQIGKFALWVHNGSAEFNELTISPLVPSKESAAQLLAEAETAAAVAKLKTETARFELSALKARIAVERAKAAGGKDEQILALAAGKAERRVLLAKAEEELLRTVRETAGARERLAKEDAETKKLLAATEKKLTDAQAKVAKAQAATEKDDPAYTSLEIKFPTKSTGRRLALARWIVDPENPRTARVAVNHIWRRHFGSALQPSLSDFGLRSKPRTHPGLLDWLAVELTENDWSTKHMHRLIVTSRAYRMKSSIGDQDSKNVKVDPGNRYLWRMNWRRMEAEAVRDSVLHAAGRLDVSLGGAEIPENQGQTSLRRSLYFRTTPNETMEFLELFDLANPNECYERKESVVPQQVLAMTNSIVSLSNSRILAGKLTAELAKEQEIADKDITDSQFVAAAFEQVLCRQPSQEEQTRCLEFLQSHAALLKQSGQLSAFPAGAKQPTQASKDPAIRARENLVHVLFNHNDFVTIR